MWTEYPSWSCPSTISGGHVLVGADFSIDKEDGSYVVIPCLYRLANFPKLINIGRRVSVSESKFTSDGVKAAFRHESPKAIG